MRIVGCWKGDKSIRAFKSNMFTWSTREGELLRVFFWRLAVNWLVFVSKRRFGEELFDWGLYFKDWNFKFF